MTVRWFAGPPSDDMYWMWDGRQGWWVKKDALDDAPGSSMHTPNSMLDAGWVEILDPRFPAEMRVGGGL